MSVDRRTSLRLLMMPSDTNNYGTIFGGVILSGIDQAAFVEARSHANLRWVTAAIDRVEFKAPVHTGDLVTFHTRTTRLGTTSVTVSVEVEAERFTDGTIAPVTSASLVMVAVDSEGRPVPFRTASPIARENQP